MSKDMLAKVLIAVGGVVALAGLLLITTVNGMFFILLLGIAILTAGLIINAKNKKSARTESTGASPSQAAAPQNAATAGTSRMCFRWQNKSAYNDRPVRLISIVRPSRFQSSAVSLNIYLDGDRKRKIGKLSNGKTVSFELDGYAHTVHLDGGAMGPPDFHTEVYIPAGNSNYCFQTDLMEYRKTGNYKPMLRPIAGTCVADGKRPLNTIADTALSVFLNEKVINTLKENAGAMLEIAFSENGWQINVVIGTQRYNVINTGYPTRTGSIFNNAIGQIEAQTFETVQARDEALSRLYSEYLQYLPEYQPVNN